MEGHILANIVNPTVCHCGAVLLLLCLPLLPLLALLPINRSLLRRRQIDKNNNGLCSDDRDYAQRLRFEVEV